MNKCPKCGFKLNGKHRGVSQCPKCHASLAETEGTLEIGREPLMSSEIEARALQASGAGAAKGEFAGGAQNEPTILPDSLLIEGGESTKSVVAFDPSQMKPFDIGTPELNDEPTQLLELDERSDDFNPTLVSFEQGGQGLVGLDIPNREIGGLVANGQGVEEFDYELVREVGRGATGVVYRARQASLNRDVALKMLAKQKEVKKEQRKTALKEDDVKKFLYESQITARLDHPNIIIVHDLGKTSSDTIFYSMKLLEGQAWNHTLAKNSLRENLEIFDRVCDAMRFAHREQIIHRDLKPENVLVGQFGEVQVTDWGLALDLKKLDGTLFNAGGTPCYMAPEMAQHYLLQTKRRWLAHKQGLLAEQGVKQSVAERRAAEEEINRLEAQERDWQDEIGTASDVYVLGTILFHVAQGYPPHLCYLSEPMKSRLGPQASEFKKQKELEMSAAREIANYKMPPKDDQIARDALREIALKAMELKVEDRYSGVAAFQKAVQNFRNLMQSIDLTERGQNELRNAAAEPDSYQNFANARYAFDEAIQLWDANENAKLGSAQATIEYARRARDKSDYELGLSLLTEQAITAQPNPQAAVQLRDEIKSLKRRRDTRQRVFWIGTLMAATVIIAAIPILAWTTRSVAVAQTAKEAAETAKEEAETNMVAAQSAAANATQQLKDVEPKLQAAAKELDDALAAKSEAETLKVNAELAKQEADLEAQNAKREALEATQAATLAQSEAQQASKNAEVAIDLAKDAEKRKVELELENRLAAWRIQQQSEAAQLGTYLANATGIAGALENLDVRVANRNIEQVFSSENIANTLKNSWEMHRYYQRSNPAGRAVAIPDASFVMLQTSRDGGTTVGVTTDGRIGKLIWDGADANLFQEIPDLQLPSIRGVDLSADGRYLAIIQDVAEQANLAESDRLPIVVDLTNNQTFRASPELYQEFQFTSKSIGPNGKEVVERERFYFGGQYVQILNAVDGKMELLTVDRRVENGLNLFRCSIVPLQLSDNRLIKDESKNTRIAKVPGRSLSNPAILSGAECLVSAYQSISGNDSEVTVAIAVGYPTVGVEYGVCVFDVGADNPADDETFALQLRNRIARLELPPTRLLLTSAKTNRTNVNDDTLALYVGTSLGKIARFDCQQTDGQPGRNLLISYYLLGHRDAVRNILVDEQNERLYTASPREIVVWNAQSGNSLKQLYGHADGIVDLALARQGKSVSLVTVANDTADAATNSEMRVWEPAGAVHDAELKIARPTFASSTEPDDLMIANAMDLQPGSKAVIAALKNGDWAYTSDPASQPLNVIPNPAAGLDMQSNDLRQARMGLYDERYLVLMHDYKLQVWDLLNRQQTRAEEFEFTSDISVENTDIVYSDDRQGNLIVSSHPTKKNYLLQWRREAGSGGYIATEVGPFSNTSIVGLRPIVSPDGQFVAVVSNRRITYSIDIFTSENLAKGEISQPMASLSGDNYSQLRFAKFSNGSNRFVLGQERAIRNLTRQVSAGSEDEVNLAERTLDLSELRLQSNQWEQRSIPVPAGLLTNAQVLITDWMERDGQDWFLGLSRSAVESNNETGTSQLVIWNDLTTAASLPVPFSRRLNPQFSSDGTLVQFLSQGLFNRWTWQSDREGDVESIALTSSTVAATAQFWQVLASDHIAYFGRDWLACALPVADGNILENVLEVSRPNDTRKIWLYGRHIAALHLDGSVTLAQLDEQGQLAKHRQLNGRQSQVVVSPDGQQVAVVSADKQRVSTYRWDDVLADRLEPVHSWDQPADLVTWVPQSWTAGGADVAGHTLATIVRKDQTVELAVLDGNLNQWSQPSTLTLPQRNDWSTLRDVICAAQTGQYFAVIDDRNHLSLWRRFVTPQQAVTWVPIDTTAAIGENGEVVGLAISEVLDDAAAKPTEVATRFAIATRNGNEIRTDLYLFQYSNQELIANDSQRQFELTRVLTLDAYQQKDRDIAMPPQFSGDGKTLQTANQDELTQWLTKGWEIEKRQVGEADRVFFSAEELQEMLNRKLLNSSEVEQLQK